MFQRGGCRTATHSENTASPRLAGVELLCGAEANVRHVGVYVRGTLDRPCKVNGSLCFRDDDDFARQVGDHGMLCVGSQGMNVDTRCLAHKEGILREVLRGGYHEE